MKLIQHVLAVQKLLASGTVSKDFRFSDRLIAHFLKVARSLLIEQKIDKYYYLSEQSYQSLCVSLELGSFHNCCEAPSSDCLVLKSVDKLPKFLSARFGDFVKVMTLEGKVISKTSPTIEDLEAYSLTNKTSKLGWFIHDNHLYIVDNTKLKLVLLNALYADPEEIDSKNCVVSGTNCPEYLDTEFPIDPDLIDPMYKLTLQYLLQRGAQDLENDAKDNTIQ